MALSRATLAGRRALAGLIRTLETGQFRHDNYSWMTRIAGPKRGAAMAKLPQDLSILREKIDRQRNTVKALKRDGHECADAERQLRQMLADLEAGDKNSPGQPDRPSSLRAGRSEL